MKLIAPIALALAVFVAAPASAATISQAGDSFSATLGGNVNGSAVPGLTATAMFVVSSYTQDLSTGSTQIVVDITLSNTSDANIWQSTRLSAVGFDTSPLISNATASGLFGNAVIGGAFPNGFGSIDVCATNNNNNCQGGQGGGLDLGQTGTVTMTLGFDSLVNSVDISNLGIRWQSLDSSTLGISGASGTGGSNPIPEPSAALAFGIGLVIITARLRRGF